MVSHKAIAKAYVKADRYRRRTDPRNISFEWWTDSIPEHIRREHVRIQNEASGLISRGMAILIKCGLAREEEEETNSESSPD